MEVIKITDNDDGTSTVDIDLTQDEINFFLSYAINDFLKKYIERIKNENNICPSIS